MQKSIKVVMLLFVACSMFSLVACNKGGGGTEGGNTAPAPTQSK